MLPWRKCTYLAAVIGLSLLVSGAKADVLAFDRGLPVTNVNAWTNRSNTTWGFPGNATITGDDFSLSSPHAGTLYNVGAIRIWTADGPDATFDFADMYTALALYGAVGGESLSLLEAGSFTGGTALDNPNIRITPVTYQDGSSYQGGEAVYQLWQVDFTNLNWTIPGNTAIQFGILGTSIDPDYFWVTHASTAALSGSPQQGADGLFLSWDGPEAAPTAWDSSDPDIWGQPSDINLQVFATPVPEPGSLLLLGAALAGIGVAARRRR